MVRPKGKKMKEVPLYDEHPQRNKQDSSYMM